MRDNKLDNDTIGKIWQKLGIIENYIDGNEATHQFVLETKDLSVDSLENILGEVSKCKKCSLHISRKNVVVGSGTVKPKILIIGEGPGVEEDKEGLPFVGASGELLNKMLAAININRVEDCYITNIVKCRPPHNRDPELEERSSCSSFLLRQINLLNPKIIFCLGRVAVQSLLNTAEALKNLRGRWFDFEGIAVIATWHPSAILRDPDLKRSAWEDLKLLRDRIIKLSEFNI